MDYLLQGTHLLNEDTPLYGFSAYPAELKQLLSESTRRSSRKKIPEIILRQEDCLKLFRSIAEPNMRFSHNMEILDVYSSNS